jgi:hypothetical protein
MDIKAATEIRTLKIGNEVITVNTVKGDNNLFRVMINQTFKGYIQKRDGELHRLDGSSIHDLIFARVCQLMEN